MRKLKISLIIILLGSIIISFLLLPQFNKVPYDSSGTQLQTKDYDEVNYDEDPISPPKPSSGIRYAKVFNISASADDAWTDSSAVPRTFPVAPLLHLGGQPNLPNAANRKICLRWNVSIPVNTSVISAYLNLTLQSSGAYNGFTATVLPFNSSNTPDFSDVNENIRLTRTRSTPGVSWAMPVPVTVNETYTSPNIASLMNRIIDRADWKNNSIFGLYIQASTALNERLFFHSFDGPNPDYIPKLIVEWEANPGFRSIPSDLTIQNQTRGYHIEWTAADDNPKDYIIIGNYTFNTTTNDWEAEVDVVQNGNWTSDVEIRYNIPKIDIKNYPFVIINYTITIYDEDGKFDKDTVLVTVDDIYPIIDIFFNQSQSDKAYSYLDRNYLDTDKGPFTLRIYNNTPCVPSFSLYAFYPENNLVLNTILMVLGIAPFLGIVSIDEWTYYTAIYTSAWTYSAGHSPGMSASVINYNDELGCWQLTPAVGLDSGKGAHNHTFELSIYLPALPGLSIYEYYGLPVQKLYYDLTNYFSIGISSALGTEFIYNQTVYGGAWETLIIDVLNKDLSPPRYGEPEFIEPEEPDLHYEINIYAYPEEKGAEIDEVYLYYKIDDGAWKKTEMVRNPPAGEEYKYYGEIPPQEGGAEITYYIEIVDIAGNIATTDEFEETAVTFEEISPIIPILGILLAFLGALSLVVIFRYRSKRAFKKAGAEKLIKKPKKGVIKK